MKTICTSVTGFYTYRTYTSLFSSSMLSSVVLFLLPLSMTSISQHVGRVSATTAAAPSRCSPFKSRTARNQSLLMTLLMKISLQCQVRVRERVKGVGNSQYCKAAPRARGPGDHRSSIMFHSNVTISFSCTVAAEQYEKLSPVGASVHEIPTRSATSCHCGIDRVTTPSGRP
jgi:hypothetical protein